MLLYLRVKNLALIDSAEVEFGEGLNILTGETGAGKSVVIGSVNVALGGKASRDLIRQGCDSAYVELCFQVEEEKRPLLAGKEVYPDEDGLLIISKRITPARSISRVNDETVTASRLREITGLLIDIHGQHEHQSLLYHARHLEILDEYGKERLSGLKKQVEETYRRYQEQKKELEAYREDEESRLREMDFCRFEIDEIEEANVKPGEEEELEAAFKRFSNAKRIEESLSEAGEAVRSDAVSRALRSVEGALRYDENLVKIRDSLCDVESLLGDLEREIGDYLESLEFDGEEAGRVEARLDRIRALEHKYGRTIPDILENLQKKKERLEVLEHYDALREEAQARFEKTCGELSALSERLGALRREVAVSLASKMEESLRDLNFLDVTFTVELRKLGHFTAKGQDEAEFLISTNPGEPPRPLGQVASGGELSRIMLAIKTVLADTDQIPTLIFDEIDAGISGRTAQRVSEKLRIIGRRRQVICITHLPQIAAMADHHFAIEKSVSGGRTVTQIRPLDDQEAADELARLLGGAQITETVRQNAREMKRLADEIKKK